jgi:hypothetical protein
MTHLPEEVERVAKGLSPTQQEAMIFLPRGYFDPNTIKSLRRRGLIGGSSPTSLGEAVRDYLKEAEER